MRYLLFLVVLVSNLSFASGYTIQINESLREHLMFANQVEIFKDSLNSAKFEEILANPDKYNFTISDRREEFSECANCTYWIRFKVQETGRKSLWILEILDSRFKEFVLYLPDEAEKGGYRKSVTGTKYGFEAREYDHKNFAFDLPIVRSSENLPYYYLQINPGTFGSFLFKIRQTKFFASYGFKEYLMLGMYYGILLVMAFYNLFLFFSIRERVYVYYFFFVIVWACNCSFEDGIGFQFLWPHSSIVPILGLYLSRSLLVGFYILYAVDFLNLEHTFPKFKKIFLNLAIGFIVFNTLLTWLEWYIPNYILLIVTFSCILYTAFKVYNSGYRPAWYFLLGNSVIGLGILLHALRNEAIFNFFHEKSDALMVIMVYIKNICMVIDIIILSMALGARIKFLKEETSKAQQKIIDQLEINNTLGEKLNKELEVKVEERTKTIEEKSRLLEVANQQLKQQAEEISKMNAILDIDNWNLKKNIKEEKEARISLKDINFKEFSYVYPNESSCFHFLEELKWEGGYKCRKCGNQKFNRGISPFSRRCSKCRYDESITAYTIFHRCKFEITKALYITVMINRYGDSINISELSRELEVRNATCWSFFQKVLGARNSKGYDKLSDNEKLKFLISNYSEVPVKS